MTHKIAFLLALAASVLSVATNFEKKEIKTTTHISITSNR